MHIAKLSKKPTAYNCRYTKMEFKYFRKNCLSQMERQEIRNLHFLKTQVSIRIWEEILLSKLKVTQRSKMRQKWTLYIISVLLYVGQPRSPGLRGETVTKTLVKFVLSFQNFGGKIACEVRHNCIQLYCNTVVSHCACDFFPKILER